MIDSGWTRTSIRSSGKPKSHEASMISSPLFMRVALSTLIFRPMLQRGCLTAISGVMPERSRRPRKGPPEAVRMILASFFIFSSAAARHWKTALCSLSTGRSSAPFSAIVFMRSAPPQTTLSLLASMRRFPALAAAKVGATPAAPTIACSTASASGSSASARTAAAPACASTSFSPAQESAS